MIRQDSPLVSLVSIFHNRVDLVDESVRSMLAQDYPHLEILIYDDGSTDGTAEALLAYSDPRLRVVTQPNAGFTKTLNRAIRSSSGEIVALHGSGDVTAPQRISRQVDALLSADDVGLVGCLTDRSHGRIGPVKKFTQPLSGNIHQRALKGGMPFTYGASMFRRSVFDEIGGFREFFVMSQGRDFSLRMPAHLRYVVVPEPLYRKINPPDSISTTASKLILQRYLLDFAVQCARARDRGQPDPLEKLGPAAAFLREGSVEAATQLHIKGVRWLCYGDADGGRQLLKAAADERLSWRTFSGGFLIAASQRPALWRVLRPLVRRTIAHRTASAGRG